MVTQRGNRVVISVPFIDDILVDYDTIRLYRTSYYPSTYTLIASIPLVAGKTSYVYQDVDGAIFNWYRTAFYHSGTSAQSEYSEPFAARNAPTTSLMEIARLAAQRLGLHGLPRRRWDRLDYSGWVTAASTSSTIVSDLYIGGMWPDDAFVGWYMAFVGGENGSQNRQILSFNRATGTFTVDAFPVAPAINDPFDLFGEFPSSRWVDFVEDARYRIWVPFDYPITGIPDQTEYVLPSYIADRKQITGASWQIGKKQLNRKLIPGIDFTLDDQQPSGLVLRADLGKKIIILHGYRNPPRPVSWWDDFLLGDNEKDLWIVTAASFAARSLAQARYGSRRDDRTDWENVWAQLESERLALARRGPQFRELLSYRTAQMASVV